MTQAIISGLVRHLITMGGAVLIQRGITTTDGVEQLSGIGVALVGIIWSAVHKKSVHERINDAAETGIGV